MIGSLDSGGHDEVIQQSGPLASPNDPLYYDGGNLEGVGDREQLQSPAKGIFRKRIKQQFGLEACQFGQEVCRHLGAF